MELRLMVGGKEKSELVDFKVDYSYQPKDLMVIFESNEIACDLDNGKYSSPYDEYCFKRIQNVIVGSFKHRDQTVTLTLAEYLNGNHLYLLIIHQECKNWDVVFEIDQDIYHTCFRLFDYSEYRDACEITGTDPLSKRDFISATFNNAIVQGDYSLFNTIPRQRDFNLFLNQKGLTDFFYSEEIRTAN